MNNINLEAVLVEIAQLSLASLKLYRSGHSEYIINNLDYIISQIELIKKELA